MRAATLTLPGYAAFARNTEPRTHTGHATAKRVALAVAAPFATVAFVVGFPFFGLAMLGWLAVGAALARWKTAARYLRNLALFVAAPFVALAYAMAFPFVGLGLLAWVAVHREARAA